MQFHSLTYLGIACGVRVSRLETWKDWINLLLVLYRVGLPPLPVSHLYASHHSSRSPYSSKAVLYCILRAIQYSPILVGGIKVAAPPAWPIKKEGRGTVGWPNNEACIKRKETTERSKRGKGGDSEWTSRALLERIGDRKGASEQAMESRDLGGTFAV